MPRPRTPVPIPRCHKNSAVIDVWKGSRRVQIVFGPWRSKDAEREYKRFLAGFAAGTFDKPDGGVTVAEAFLSFLLRAEEHYRRPDGTQTNEVIEFKRVVTLTREMYGDELTREFGPLKFEAVRQVMIGKGWCRTRINQQVGRHKRIFKWGTSKQLVPPTVFQGLQSLTGLQRGRTKAVEREPFKPVEPTTVAATMSFLARHVGGMVRLHC